MKFVTFVENDGPDRLGALLSSGDVVVDLSAQFPSMLALIDGGPEALTIARVAQERRAVTQPLANLRLKAPLPEPRQMRDCLSFEKHLRQARQAVLRRRAGIFAPLLQGLGFGRIPKVWYEQPIYYKCNRFSVIGPDAEVTWPAYSKLMDFECEYGIVIGKRGKNIPREKALEHIFGYCIFNDFSARDAQSREMAGGLGPAKGKDFDTGNALGPWLVTADEIPDPGKLTMIARVNGVEWSRGSSADMYHKWEDIIAHISKDETLHAGEFIGSGTVGGGCGLEQGRFLQSNDVVELEVSGLGILRNRVIGS